MPGEASHLRLTFPMDWCVAFIDRNKVGLAAVMSGYLPRAVANLRIRWTVLLLAIPFAWAPNAYANEPGITPEDSFDRVIDAAVGDWDKDGRNDLALLIVSPTQPTRGLAELRIYMRRDADGLLLAPALTVPDSIWGSWRGWGLRGQEPALKVLANGSLAIVERNESSGRYRFTRQRALAWRNGTFVLAGFTDATHDTIAMTSVRCDLNLLTGDGVLNDKPVRFPPQTISLADSLEFSCCQDVIQP